VFDNLNDRIRPTKGQRFIFSQDFAGLGGSVRYLRTKAEGHKYWGFGGGWILSANGEGGYIKSLEADRGPGVDKIRLTDRFFLGQPDFAGFNIRGIGPRVLRRAYLYDTSGNVVLDANGREVADPNRQNASDDSLGGRAYYFGKLELQVPLGSGARELGIRPSIFANIGSVFGVKKPILQSIGSGGQFREIPNLDGSRLCLDNSGAGRVAQTVAASVQCPDGYDAYGQTIPGFSEEFLGDTWKPRISVGVGVNWNSPFGPFRIDVAKALVKYPGDNPKLFTFNVGTQF
jgi:outer membrane protein insertion porin family